MYGLCCAKCLLMCSKTVCHECLSLMLSIVMFVSGFGFVRSFSVFACCFCAMFASAAMCIGFVCVCGGGESVLCVDVSEFGVGDSVECVLYLQFCDLLVALSSSVLLLLSSLRISLADSSLGVSVRRKLSGLMVVSSFASASDGGGGLTWLPRPMSEGFWGGGVDGSSCCIGVETSLGLSS